MRLTQDEQFLIKRIVAEIFGEDAVLWLFGSRVDDTKRGGDVDLYVVPVAQDDLFMKRVRCLGRLEAVLPYPVDLVVADKSASRPIDRIALKTGVLL
jgi:predicted nucleotidyltransferase